MGIGHDGVVKLVQNGIEAQEEHRSNAEKLALLYIEFGYKCCEEGLNLEAAILKYRRVTQGKSS